MEGVAHLYDTKQQKGVAVITTYDIRSDDIGVMMHNLRAVRDGNGFSQVRDGHYVKLHVEGSLMMSDTHMERSTNDEFVRNANGRVLIAGLGIGLIIHNIISREDVTEVMVVEKYQDVIDLVSPKFSSSKLKIVCANIFDWIPPKGEKFDTIYFDIWPDICEDNLKEIKVLHNRFKFKLNRDNPSSWMNSWMKEYLQSLKRRERNSSWNW